MLTLFFWHEARHRERTRGKRKRGRGGVGRSPRLLTIKTSGLPRKQKKAKSLGSRGVGLGVQLRKAERSCVNLAASVRFGVLIGILVSHLSPVSWGDLLLCQELWVCNGGQGQMPPLRCEQPTDKRCPACSRISGQ